MGDEQYALENYKESIETFPPYLPAYWELAGVYEDSKQFGSALHTLRAALEHTKNESYRSAIERRIRRLEEAVSSEGGGSEKSVPEMESNHKDATEKNSDDSTQHI
jgi:tetratricopeptide (TPR) repeat protein